MSEAAVGQPTTPTEAAIHLVKLIASAGPADPHSWQLTMFEAMMIDTARKVYADLRRERDGTSRSGIPLTRRTARHDRP